MKTVAIVDAHFVPSNLTGVHRPRMWTYHLADFGWKPIIVTTHWRHYNCQVVPELFDMVPDDLEVIRTKAFPTSPFRFIGDVGIRGFYFHYQALWKLANAGQIDFLLITVPSFYSSLLGRLLYLSHGIPYGIDYQDPWVHEFPVSEVPLGELKARMSTQIAKILEPIAVADASLISGISPSYIEGTLERNSHLRDQATVATMQVGIDQKDFEILRDSPRPKFLWDDEPQKKTFRFLYAGAMLPRAYPVLDILLQALRQLKKSHCEIAQRLEFYFVGTGTSPDDPRGYNVKPRAEKYGVSDLVFEHPDRISYLDVLNHLEDADGSLVIGSTEPHYSPSKVYQAVLAKTPIFALLHEDSSATSIIQKNNTGQVVAFADGRLPLPNQAASSLKHFVEEYDYNPDEVGWEHFKQYTARECTRELAEALDEAYAQSEAVG